MYGYISSINFDPANWMHQLHDVIKDRQVRHLVMPGFHDAGMGRISSTYVNDGNSGNTQTQGLQIYDQLRVGARWFDLRIVTVDTSGFWAAHVDDESKVQPYSATGQSFDSIIDDINKFTAGPGRDDILVSQVPASPADLLLPA